MGKNHASQYANFGSLLLCLNHLLTLKLKEVKSHIVQKESLKFKRIYKQFKTSFSNSK